MNPHKLVIPLAGCAGLALLCGCAKPVVFATHSSIGLDVSGTAQYPNKVSLSYNREEAALVPRKTDGQAHSVYGGLDSDISFWRGSVIKQTFATGEAAKIATGGGDGSGPQSTNKSTASLVFFTGTTFGLHLTAGESQMSPNLVLGYRRAEAACIPVPDPNQEVRSVYADVLINTKSRTAVNESDPAMIITTNFPTVSGVRIKQSFATGRAAENLAATAAVQEKLNAAAGLSTGELKQVAVTEHQILEAARGLPKEKQHDLLAWADDEFPEESNHALAGNGLDDFGNRFLPKLEPDQLARVYDKIKELER